MCYNRRYFSLIVGAGVTPKESLHRDYGLLTGFLRSISLRFQLRVALEFLLLLTSGFILVLLGGLFVIELKEVFPYLPFFYSFGAILFLSFLLLLGLWRFFSKPSMERVARRLEEKFPQLRDDVINSLLLFNEIVKSSGLGQISEGLITAQLRKTVHEVSIIKPWQVVNIKGALRHLRLLLPLALTFSLVFALDPHFLSRSLALIIHPFSALPMKETSISLEPRGLIVLRGTQLVINAKVTGYVPEKLTLEVWPDGREAIHLPMNSEGNRRFTYRMASAQFSFRYQAHGGHGTSPVYNIRVVDPPEVGKVKLTLIPPEYTHLPKEVRQEGHIEALKGTMVNLEAQTNKPVKEGKIVLNQGNQVALSVKEDHLMGSLVIFYPGTYSIHMKDELGFDNPNPVQYPIHLIPDKYPQVEIISPAQDLEVVGTEVTPIVYTARDDFGITAVRLSYQMGGIERFISLKSANSGRSLGPETFKWDLTGLALTPGDRVVYRLEVWDNDSVSGPKAGYSRTFTLYVGDERAKAAKEGEEAQQIEDALLDLLADQMEETKDMEELSQRLTKILERVDKNLERMGEDKIQRYDLEALKRNLASLNKRVQEEQKETVTRELERLALLAEDVAKKARMNEVEALAREIRNRERRLIDMLRDSKGPSTSEALEAMMKELEKLRQLLQTVMDALSKMATQLPDEFINSPELRGMDFQDLFKDLDEIQKRLMAGDLGGALEAAQRLLQTLSEMMAALSRAGAQANMGSFDRLQGEMARQTSELERILGQQKEILTGTEGIDREMKRRVEEETEKRLSHSLARFQELLEGLRPSLPAEQSDSIEELERLLNEGQLEKFSELVKNLKKEPPGRSNIQKLIEELTKMAEKLSPDSNEVMTPDNKEKFPNLSSQQEGLQSRTRNLTEKLEMLSQLFPGMDTEILNDLKGATDSMGKASGRLRGEDAPGAIPPEQEAIRSLTKSQQAMQQMAQQMAMQMQNRWGYLLSYDPRPGWYYGPWVPMPTLPQPESRRPRERGYTGIDREEFDPPSKDAYKAPQILREKVMESLKEEVPSQYRREVERYFKGLTE
jgi:soluble cytochrome b562